MRQILLAAALFASPALAHDIYGGLRIKDGTLPCCGGEDAGANRDCWRTVYRERGDAYQFRLLNGDWVQISQDRIQFTPIPGDPHQGDDHEAHLCYRDDAEVLGNYRRYPGNDRLLRTVGGAEIVFFCAIIPPGGT